MTAILHRIYAYLYANPLTGPTRRLYGKSKFGKERGHCIIVYGSPSLFGNLLYSCSLGGSVFLRSSRMALYCRLANTKSWSFWFSVYRMSVLVPSHSTVPS